MVKSGFVITLGLLLAVASWGQDQQQMNRQAHEEFVQADKKLNQVYRQLLPKLQKAEKDRLVEAQLLWIKYRDANAEARAEANQGGSLYPLIYDGSRRRTTEARTQELQEWLDEFVPAKLP